MGGNGNQYEYARTGRDGSIWAAVAEKMFAKWYGNYEHLQGGWMHRAVTALNGSPAQWRHHNNNHQEIWDFITEADADHDIITAATNFCGSDKETTENGIACSHAYTVIANHVLTRKNGE